MVSARGSENTSAQALVRPVSWVISLELWPRAAQLVTNDDRGRPMKTTIRIAPRNARRTRLLPPKRLNPATRMATAMATSAVRVWVPINAAIPGRITSRALRRLTIPHIQRITVRPTRTAA